jgi:uncharacterized protein (TIRG00374 family)
MSFPIKRIFSNLLKFTVFLGTGVGLLYLVYRHQAKVFAADCALKGIPASECSLINKIWTDFQGIAFGWFILVIAFFLISNASRALRWNMLLRPMGYAPRFSNAFLTILVGYFLNLALPRVGEIARCGAFSRYERIPLEKVLGTVVVDRIIDLLSILFLTLLAFILEYDTILQFVGQHVTLGGKGSALWTILWVLLPVSVLGAVVAWKMRHRLLQLGFFQKILSLLNGFWEGIQTIRQLERPWLFVLHSINIWFMFFLMSYIAFKTFGATSGLPMVAALMVFVFATWGVVVPSPGGMGSYHFMVQTALALYGVSHADGFSYANIFFFLIQLGGNILMGMAALLLLPIINRGYQPKLPGRNLAADLQTA